MWTIDDETLSTKVISDDKSVMGVVSLSEFDALEDEKIAIFDTTQLRSLLKVLDNDIKLSFGKTGTRVTSLKMDDKNTKVSFMLADEKVIPEVPSLKSLPDFGVELTIDRKFSNTFVKAKSAMGDSAETFTVTSNGGKKAQVILGHSSINSNRVTLETEAPVNEKLEAISFAASYLSEILIANKECETGTIAVSANGLAHVSFTHTDNFSTDYYLVEVQKG
jgi:hypothetical protein